MVTYLVFSNFTEKRFAMRSSLQRIFPVFIIFPVLLLIHSCADIATAKTTEEYKGSSPIMDAEKKPARKISDEFRSYWYSGVAEITSYKLEQARYGELRDGHAVLVFVTEPFLPEIQVKADRNGPENVSVLKLNSTKKYLTGIYPYSIMTSSFYPVSDNQHAIKLSTSVQEWCGHVYSQLNNREDFEIESHSYFEGEADMELTLPKAWLENEVWNKIRINPDDLPLGEIQMIPSLEFIRTGHKKFRAYPALATLSTTEGISKYTISYKDLDRTLSIEFRQNFPYSIEGWTETFKSGYGPNSKTLTSKATKISVLKTPYWRQNGKEDEILRKDLGIQ